MHIAPPHKAFTFLALHTMILEQNFMDGSRRKPNMDTSDECANLGKSLLRERRMEQMLMN